MEISKREKVGIEFLKWYLYSNFRGALLTQSCYFKDVYVYTMILNDSQQLWNIWCRDITSTLVETSWLTLNLGIESVMGVWLYIYIYIYTWYVLGSIQTIWGEMHIYIWDSWIYIYIYIYNTAPIAPSYPHDIPIIIYVYPHDVQNCAWSKVSTVMAREFFHSYHSCNNW